MADDAGIIEQIIFGSPTTDDRGRLLASPFQFHVTGVERLRLTVTNSVAGVFVVARVRTFTPGGDVQVAEHAIAARSDRTSSYSDFPLDAGFILNMEVVATGATTRIGQTFVRVQIVRGDGAAALPFGTLIQGYVTSNQALAWPGSPVESSIAGGGVLRLIDGTTPAAGAEISETVPTGARWELLNVHATIGTSAAAGNRRPMLAFVAGAVGHWLRAQTGTVGPSQSATVIWAANVGDAAVGSPLRLSAPLPTGQNLLEGFQIVGTTDALDAGDTYINIKLLVREWLEAA